MRTAPEVSVIVPVYNQSSSLRSTLARLGGQTLAAAQREIVVVDDGSSDDSLATARAAQQVTPGLQVASLTTSRGSYAARNHGVGISSGAVLAFTDADCEPDPAWLEQGLRALAAGAAEIAAGRIERTFAGGRPNLWEYLDASMFLDQELHVAEHGFGVTANLFVARDLFDRVGAFAAGLQSGGDYEFCHRAGRDGARIVYAPHALVRHPARARAREVFAKTRRVARGLRHLEHGGALEHNRLSWRHFAPARHYPSPAGARPSLAVRLAAPLAVNLLKYWSLLWRLG